MKQVKIRKKYSFIGSDYSAQEPRTLTAMSGDETLLSNFKEGRDMYATLGMKVYRNRYEDNLEHYPDGTKNEEGAKRRKKMKVLYLGRPSVYAHSISNN